MAGDDEVLIARRLTMLLTDRRQFGQLEEAYCRLRLHHPPTAALDRALAEVLPSGEHGVVAAFIWTEGEAAHDRGGVPPVHHSVIDGLEELYEERQSSERDERRERMDVADLASDLAADAQLAAAYGEGCDKAARWLERFPSMVLVRASASPTPTGRRLRLDQARKALLATETHYRARTGDEAEGQVAWCVALRDSLVAGGGDSGDVSGGQSTEGRLSDELDDVIGTAHVRPDATAPPLPILDVVRSEPMPLGDEDALTALIEAANGHDDHHDPADDRTVEAMESLLDQHVLESDDTTQDQVDGRVRSELWTHMLWGYRVGRYLLTAHRRSILSSDPNSASYAASDLVTYVGQSYQRRDVKDLVSSPDLSAALHYHPVSSILRRACLGDKAWARRWVTLTEDLGFLTALGEEDLVRGPAAHIGETGSSGMDATAGVALRHSRVTDVDARMQVGREA